MITHSFMDFKISKNRWRKFHRYGKKLPVRYDVLMRSLWEKPIFMDELDALPGSHGGGNMKGSTVRVSRPDGEGSAE